MTQRPVAVADAHRPNLAQALEVERWVPRIGLEKLEILVRERLHLLGQRIVKWTPCASKRPGLVCTVVGHRFVDEAVKFPRCRVGFNLSVPNLGVEVREPLPELREFLGGEALDKKLKLFDGAHV